MSSRRVFGVALFYVAMLALTFTGFVLVPRLMPHANPYRLEADRYVRAWLDVTKPDDPWADPPRYTDDPAVIGDIVAYINDLTLRERTTIDDEQAGRTMRIELYDAQGAMTGFRVRNNAFIAQDGGETYVMRLYLTSQALDARIYPRMRPAAALRGTVVDVSEDDADRLMLSISPREPAPCVAAGHMRVTVPHDRVYRDGAPGAFVAAGDDVEFYVDGDMRGTACRAWRVELLPREPEGLSPVRLAM